MPDVRVDYSGPFFQTALRHAAAQKMVEGINRSLTNLAFARVHQILRKDLKHPTGYYQSNIIREIKNQFGRVHDNNVIYGPWLEGVSSRNRETRFKGYFAFRRATQSVTNQGPRIAQPHITRFIKTLGG